MGIFGLPFYNFQRHSKMEVFLIFAFGLLMLWANVASNIYFAIHIFCFSKANFEEQAIQNVSSVLSLFVYMQVLFEVCYRIGTHLSFLRTFYSPWKSFLECVHQLEQEFRLSSTVYRKLRQFSIVGISILIMVCTVTIVEMS